MRDDNREVHLNKLERAVLDKLLAGDHPVLAALRCQVARSSIRKRQFSGKGFFTDFQLSPGHPPVPSPRSRIRFGDVFAELHGVEGGAGFLLFVDDGFLVALEGYVFMGSWPSAPRIQSLYYDPEPRNLSALE